MLRLNQSVGNLIFLAALAAAAPAVAGQAASGAISFNRDIQPILSENCFKCHGPDATARKGKLRLDRKSDALGARGEKPAVILPGRSAESPVVQRILTTDPEEVMPPPKSNLKLSSQQIALLQQWIEQGARWEEHWSWSKPERPPLPGNQGGLTHGQNAVDSFILNRLRQEGLTPSPEADRMTLLRRVTLDLTGLPPSPDAIDEFLRDGSSDAYEVVVDRLLAAPAFGERMAWEWLDAARYADSNGYQGDSDRTMWPWRDWVVESFNRNLPYDQFTLWQLAGDLLPEALPAQRLATGFARNHMINGEGGRIPEENRVEYVMDMTETVGTVWLGLTFNCCRCHDHKFDPLTKRDYYSFSAFFNQTPVDGSGGDPQQPPNLEWPTKDQTRELGRLNNLVQAAGGEVERLEASRDDRSASEGGADARKKEERLQSILQKKPADRSKSEIADLEKNSSEYPAKLKELREAVEKRDQWRNGFPRVMVMEDQPQRRPTYLLERGLYDKRGEEVTAAPPARLPGLPEGAPANRLGLARWLISPENPLMARVTVNRFWQQFFGTGLVKTANDFGVQGEKPTHPELLDWLAVEFVESGWDVKRLVRLLVTSATYRQTSKITPELAEKDPENRWLARAPRFRWPSWMIRDQALALSGLASARLGGVPVKPYQPPGVWEDVSFGNKKYVRDEGEKLYRRSLYTFWRRIIAPTMFFDTASRQVCTVKLPRTNTPLQALTTLNDVTFVEAARALAERVVRECPADDRRRLRLAFRLVTGREAHPEEQAVLAGSLERLKMEFRADPSAAGKYLAVGEARAAQRLDAIEEASWAALCLGLLNLDETLSRE